MFERNDILSLKNYCQFVIEHLRPIEGQPHKIEGGSIWCDDWRIIEILKYLFNGRDMYLNDPPPNRLKHNPLWSKEKIIVEAEDLILKFKTVSAIIEELKGQRHDPSGITGNV